MRSKCTHVIAVILEFFIMSASAGRHQPFEWENPPCCTDPKRGVKIAHPPKTYNRYAYNAENAKKKMSDLMIR